MLSYLQGIRPSNRRSAVPSTSPSHHVGASRHFHGAAVSTSNAVQGSSSHQKLNERNPALPSPVSPKPPRLPPIPRVASQHEPNELPDSDHQPLRSRSEGAGPQQHDIQLTLVAESQHSLENDDTAGWSEDGTLSAFSHSLHPPSAHLISPRQPQEASFSSGNTPPDSLRPHWIAQDMPRPKSAGNLDSLPQPRRLPPPPPPPPSRPTSGGFGANQVRHGKTKLHLLNPMSLLARRRSSQVVTETTSDKPFQTTGLARLGMGLPDNYDPRIRGKVVHDFSAPRQGQKPVMNETNILPREYSKTQDARDIGQQMVSLHPSLSFTPEDESPNSSEREHTPIFKEHFNDDMEFEPHSRFEMMNQKSSAFMYQVSLNESNQIPELSSLPPFARNLPISLATNVEIASISSVSHKPSPEVVRETKPPNSKSTEETARSSSPLSPPTARSRASSNADVPFQSAGLPQRFKSNSSRFSFDMAGVGSSAQEKLLEERHRQKAKQTTRTSNGSSGSNSDNVSNDEEYDERYSVYDDHDDNGLEEKLPGVNADADDDSSDGIQNIRSPSLISHSTAIMASPKTSVLGLPSADHSHLPLVRPEPECDVEIPLAGLPHQHDYVDDDFYFDDGIAEGLEEIHDQSFDESVFDDDTDRTYGLPLRDLKQPPDNLDEPKSEFSTDKILVSDKSIENGATADSEIRPGSKNSFLEMNIIGGLTQENLAAYHDALAFATNKAALNGEFARPRNFNCQNLGEAFEEQERPKTTYADRHEDQETRDLSMQLHGQDFDDFDFNDDASDDPIIAAANAEALENDDDGFYGQEFGFFARATGSEEYANGGYFGGRGVEGIGRSHSGRANFQEPSLTPITERSEWSNRNSAISLAMHGYPHSAQQPLSSPGLAQLADLMRLDEDDLSISALMKLRRGAWGDSNISLQSSTGSPLSTSQVNLLHSRPSSVSAASPNPIATARPASSTYSPTSSNGLDYSDSDVSPSSPTVTIQSPEIPPPAGRILSDPPAASPLQLRIASDCKVDLARSRSLHLTGPSKGHSRNSSGPESVSYVQEKSEERGGGGRWVMEKRRVGEGGVMEVLEREIVEGGRI